MSLKNILLGIGRKVLGKKPDPTPTTGKSQKLLTYEGQAAQDTGQQLAKQELKNPPVVLKKTKPLQMGDDIAPAFGSSTYDCSSSNPNLSCSISGDVLTLESVGSGGDWFGTATITARGCLIYNISQSNKAVASIDFGGDKTSTAGDFTIQFPAAAASTAIIRIA